MLALLERLPCRLASQCGSNSVKDVGNLQSEHLNEWNALVAYMDLQGISAAFEDGKSQKDSNELSHQLHEAFCMIRQTLENRGHNGEIECETWTSALFSDSIFLIRKLSPQPDDYEGDFYSVFCDIAECQSKLMCSEFCVRGGVEFGPVTFENNFFCGSGIVAAAGLEKEQSAPFVYIRKQTILDMYQKACDMKHVSNIDDFFLFDSGWDNKLLYMPEQDIFIMNYMHDWPTESESWNLQSCYIQKQLKTNQDKRKVWLKYNMLRHLHNYVLQTQDDRRQLEKYAIGTLLDSYPFEIGTSQMHRLITEFKRGTRNE